MQFNSISFIFCFFPLFLAVYYIFPKSWRNGILLLGSLVFYSAAAENKILLLGLLTGLTLFTYLVGRLLAKPRRGWLLVFALAAMTGLLTFFKCYDGGRYLPAGLSFYLFQMAAYLIEIYMQEMEPERNLIAYGAQTMMFPKLLSGPLMAPHNLKEQTHHPEFSLKNFHDGLQDVILGLAMKVLLADRIAGLWAQTGVIGYESISTPFAWLALIAYAMRLYFDFWGYSLMAVGIGRMLGFHLPHNFWDPYASKSVSEFYRRWHMTLGAWFREYVYIPLGGNRRGTLRTILNLAVVWLLTGLWHGIGGNFLLWAGIILLCIIMERLWLKKFLERSKVLCHVYTVGAILLSWLPFAVGDWEQMKIYFLKLFGQIGGALNPGDYLTWGREYLWLLIVGVILATPLPRKLWNKARSHLLTDLVLLILFWIVVYFIATSAQDPFMYFQY